MDTTTLDQAQETVPGLVVFRLAPDHKPNSPHRWRIGHKPSGLAIADSLRREAAIEGAQLLGTLTDWTQEADTVKAALDPRDVFAQLSYKDCIAPGSEPFALGANVSNNGRYTDDDIRQAAAEAKASGFNALDILVAMSATVPWSGLDTEPFNEAHDRIVELADAA
ncbi:hypothetical protein OG369_10050 [Streptomyces sp. NBC_01221]|uniref:hypothetical protein n=1 Tax=Streptomyces sp. NBC_01221 TaxID=2903782 RepID=UPI0022516AD8|nr:hypothetical protein [Streptomyces sp. NBC_01221]MCX4786514.1 hypothetical protein [Streptomyces sp. NBC_01221]